MLEDNDVNFEQRIYQHRFSEERVHDPNSKIYSDLDEAATHGTAGGCFPERAPKEDPSIKGCQTKEIVPDTSVGSDQRMYAYHYWGDRSISINSPSGDILAKVRDDIGSHLKERQDRKMISSTYQGAEFRLMLSQSTKDNVQKRWGVESGSSRK